MNKGSKHFPWSTSHVRWIKANMHLTDKQMAEHIGTTPHQTQKFRHRQGLIKEHRGLFTKGIVPHNKGKASPWAKTSPVAKQHFKKGGTPHNTRKLGEVWQRNESGCPYKFIKTERGVEFLHRYVWERAKGPIPPKHRIYFADGNTLNCELENLGCMTPAQKLTSIKQDRHSNGLKAWKTRRLNIAKKVSQPYSIAA